MLDQTLEDEEQILVGSINILGSPLQQMKVWITRHALLICEFQIDEWKPIENKGGGDYDYVQVLGRPPDAAI